MNIYNPSNGEKYIYQKIPTTNIGPFFLFSNDWADNRGHSRSNYEANDEDFETFLMTNRIEGRFGKKIRIVAKCYEYPGSNADYPENP